MTLEEIETRQSELNAFCDWLTTHNPRDYMDYYHLRGAGLDVMRPGDAA